MKYTLLSLFFCAASLLHAQNLSKAFKALDDQKYADAKEIFLQALSTDENDIGGNFGMSKIHAIPAAGCLDLEKSLTYLVKCEEAWPNTPVETRVKLQDMGVTQAEIKARRDKLESAMLSKARNENSIQAIQDFMARFPESAAIPTAKKMITEMSWAAADKANTLEAVLAFIQDFPDAPELVKALPKRNQLALERAIKINTTEVYRDYLSKYPDAAQTEQVKQRLSATAFEDARKANTVDALREYIAEFPDSVFLQQAKDLLMALERGQ